MSFYCQRTRAAFKLSWAESWTQAGRMVRCTDGRLDGHAFKRGLQMWKLLRKRRERRRWRRRQLRLQCRGTRQCQFMPPKWKSKLKDLCTQCGIRVCMYICMKLHTAFTCMYMYYLLYFSLVNVIYMKISASFSDHCACEIFSIIWDFKIQFSLTGNRQQ